MTGSGETSLRPVPLTLPEIKDILTALGGMLPEKRVLGEGFTGQQRLALVAKLRALVPEERSNRAWNPSAMGDG